MKTKMQKRKKIISNCKKCKKDFLYYPPSSKGLYCSVLCANKSKPHKLFKEVTEGDKFGMLTLTGLYRSLKRSEKTRFEVEAVCDCGTIKYFTFYDLKIGKTQSCGCLGKALRTKVHTTHGMSKSRPFKSWTHMLERCFNSNDKAYKNYGGRGITVCKEWLKFENFWDAMKATYDVGLTIDRIDVNGNYCKENCRWATPLEQSRNKRNNIYLTYRGERKLLVDWAKIVPIKEMTLRRRFKKGWTINEIFNTNLHSR